MKPRQTKMFVTRSRLLPLVQPWMGGVSRALPEAKQPTCQRCQLHKDARTVCMPGDGERGGLLVVGGSPTQGDDQSGQPFSTETGRGFRRLVERHWSGPARYTNAVACRAGLKIPDVAFAACANYLAGELAGAYQRCLVVGADAAQAVFGQRLQPVMTRRAWAHVRGVPCFLVPHPQAAVHNRFVRRWMQEDVRWALTTGIPAAPTGQVTTFWDPAEAVAYLDGLLPNVPVSIDIENVGDCFKDTWRLLCIGFSTDDEHAYVIPEETLPDPAVRAAIRRFLSDPRIPKGGQFIKYDLNGLHREFDVELVGLEYDTGFMSRLVESDSPAKLGVLAWQVGFGGYKKLTEAQMGEDDDKSEAYGNLDPDDLHAYNGRDVVVTHRVHRRLTRGKRFEPFAPVWRRLVRPAISALAQVERWGARLNPDAVKAYDRWLRERYAALDARLREHKEVARTFNPNSDRQVAALLFGTLGLKSTAMTKGGKASAPKPSVGKAALEAIKDRHPVVPLIMEMAVVDKQLSTYGLPMLEHVGLDGRVHTTYNIIRSGRLSSRDPNLQNITAKGEEGKWSRGCWSAGPGNVLLSLDFSQLELRVLCDLSGDRAMAAAFERGNDYHAETAAELARIQKGMRRDDYIAALGNGTDGEKWAIDLRKAAKNINFGLVFGQGDAALAKILGVTKQVAAGLKQQVLGAFPQMARYQQKLVADASVTGEVWTDWNGCRRRRAIYKMGEVMNQFNRDEAGKDVSHATNIAKNHPIQGTASEYCLASLIEVVQRQQDGDLAGQLVITVHDELVIEAPETQAVAVAREVKAIMTGWPTRMIKLKVDCEVGPDWGHMKKLDLSGQ